MCSATCKFNGPVSLLLPKQYSRKLVAQQINHQCHQIFYSKFKCINCFANRNSMYFCFKIWIFPHIFIQRRYILSKSDHAHSPPTSLLTCSVNQSQTKTISAFFKTLHLHSKRWQGEGELVRELTSLCSRYIYNAHSARHASSRYMS